MIPLRDAGPRTRGRALVTFVLAALNVAAFLLMRMGGEVGQLESTLKFAAVPANVVGKEKVAWMVLDTFRRGFGGATRELITIPFPQGEPEGPYLQQELRQRPGAVRIMSYEIVRPALPGWLTILSSMFMHGGWAHLLGNLVFLLVFGGRLEDRLGHFRFAVFYLVTGTGAALTHVASDPQSTLPMVGASGAISGLLGGYVLLWPHGRIVTLVPFWPFWTITELPAIVFVGIWVVMQVLLIRGYDASGGGVAVWAHLGGFVYGLMIVKLFDIPARSPPRQHDWRVRRPEAWFGESGRDWP